MIAFVAPLALLCGLVVAVYLPTLGQGWAPIDDELNFVDNPHFRGFSVENLRWMATTRLAGHYIPLSWLTLALDFELYGMDPRGYHRTNLLLHLANAALFFALAWRLLGAASSPSPSPLPVSSGSASGREAVLRWIRGLASFAAAALFALHPLRVESVAWITERRDLVCGLFVLLAVHAYVTAAGAPRGSRRSLALAASVGAFLLALLGKGIAIVLPVALVALDRGPLARLPRPVGHRGGREVRAVWIEKVPFVLLSLASVGLTFWAIGPQMVERSEMGIEHRLLSAGFGLWFYLQKTLLPVAIPFQIPVVEPLSIRTDPWIALSGGAFLGLGAAAWLLRKRRPEIFLALLVFAAFVLPVSGLFQAGPQLAAHRYSYLAAMPLALLLGGGVALLGRRVLREGPEDREARRAPAPLAVVSVFAVFATGGAAWLSGAARAQVLLWRDPVTFCEAAVRDAPDAWAPTGALARAHLLRDEPGEALAALEAWRARRPPALFLSYLEALIRATSPSPALRDGALAVELARQGARATAFEDPAALFALGVANAEAGDLDLADRRLTEAAALCLAGRKPALLPAVLEARRQLAARGAVRFAADQWRLVFR